MEPIDVIRKGKNTYALFFQRDMAVDGARFLTPPDLPMQLGLMERPAGYMVEPHTHPKQKYSVQTMSEFLYIERGRIQATVFDEEWNVLMEKELQAGDFLLFLRGGHKIDVLEDARMIEVKQGPFPGDGKAKIYRDSHACSC
ncbi:hypothetical protein COU77_01430 [Candidatus Peregrinibacteria bacterium CG10_big_fil_rev_8_21_14_0_10_49_16]|nr:MAG: hypothetical protein COW95_01180 [Candidatus Peregrinibacteria bacterium CG22_combo_CG10-13_8_21_14_all_49_11]PIR52235.1 MAG: hypothetical protein COU77_01430 [Candidatus Peregrinibacteria bacterium CG10_big_fil_rev_8_21_14_0_10_49_16]